MGDFAAGKLIDGVVVADVNAENFGQFVVDIEAAFAKLHCDAPLGEPLPPGTDLGEAFATDSAAMALLGRLLSWHNGGVPLGDYTTFSHVDIFESNGGFTPEGHLPIGQTIDGDILFMDPDGNLSCDGALLGNTLMGFCGLFRDELIGNTYDDYADGWVRKA
jgi:hypothetical protein